LSLGGGQHAGSGAGGASAAARRPTRLATRAPSRCRRRVGAPTRRLTHTRKPSSAPSRPWRWSRTLPEPTTRYASPRVLVGSEVVDGSAGCYTNGNRKALMRGLAWSVGRSSTSTPGGVSLRRARQTQTTTA
jgi:hypothetical protein